jgi:hypothetical protein
MHALKTWVSGPQREVSGHGFQDLGFRPSTRGFRTWISRPGFQALESSPSYGRLIFFLSLFFTSTVTFLCVQWSQTHASLSLSQSNLSLVRSLPGSSEISRALAAWFPNPTVRAGSVDGLKRGIIVSHTDERTT